ncbi:MAG: tetratricopeptide repeat protein [Polyangiaceae bacterium]
MEASPRRHPFLRRLSALALTLAFVSAAHAAAQADEPAPNSPLPTEGLDAAHAALGAGDAARARELFEKAYATSPDAASAGGLARAEAALGLHREAAGHFALAIQLAAAGPEREALQAELASQKAFVATVLVRLTGAPASASGASAVEGTLVVDGARGPSFPLRVPVYLEPGAHQLAVDSAAGVYGPVQVTVKAGDSITVPLTFNATRGSSSKPIWPPILLGALAGAGIAAGIGTLVVSLQRESEATDFAQGIDSCNIAALSRRCAELANIVDERNSLRDGSTASFVLASVAVGAMLLYFIVPAPDDSADAVRSSQAPLAVALDVHLGPDLFGVGVRGVFQ